jgi:HEAT repeat protein
MAISALAAGLALFALWVGGRDGSSSVRPSSAGSAVAPIRLAAAPALALRVFRAPPAAVREVPVSRLLRAAKGPREEEAAAAVVALAGRPEAESVPALAALLDERRVRAEAARALARIDSPEAARALLAHRHHPEVGEAFACAGPGIEAVLVERLSAAVARDRLAAVRLLGLCGGPAAVAALEPLAADPALAPDVIRSLAAIGEPVAVEALVRLSTSPRLRREAAPYLAALDRQSLARAAPALPRRSLTSLF